MRAIGWDEVQFDASSRQGYPFPHELGVMITRVVQENMDERQHRIERLDRLQQPDRRGGVDGQGLDHPGLPSQVDRAVNVDALTPARLLDRELSWLGAQQPTGRAAWVGCTASAISTASSSPKEFSSFS